MPPPKKLDGWFTVRDRIHARMEKLTGRPIPSQHFHELHQSFRSNVQQLGSTTTLPR